MRIVVNESRIEKRKRIGERAPFIGLIILVASTVLLFAKPEWMWLSMIIVWIGLLISLTGSYLGDRYVGPYAPHKRLPDTLKGMPDDYILFLYQNRTPFILLEPGGLTVLTVKSQAGDVNYVNGNWKHQQKWGFIRRFAGQETIGRPERLAEAEVESLQAFLGKKLPEGLEVPVRGVILFTHPEIRLQVKDSPVPAIRSAELKRWLRRNVMYPKLPADISTAVLEALGADKIQEEGEA